MQLRSLVPAAVALTFALVATVVAQIPTAGEDFGPDYGYGQNGSGNTTAAPNVAPAKELKKGLQAGGWIPFVVLIVVSFFFSITYVKYYQHKREKEFGSTIVTTLALTTGLLTIALVPVDIYFVSSLKKQDGAFEDWASPQNIASLSTIAQDGYFVFYGLSILFSFLFLPLSYFFFEEKDEVENTGCCKRMIKASMFTVVFLVVLGILLAIGGFAVNASAVDTTCMDFHPGMNSTEWEKWAKCRAKFTEQALTANHGMNALFFAVGALCILGYLFFIFYTGVGMVVLPLNMIRSRGKISADETEELNRGKTVNRETSRNIKTKYAGQQRKMTAKDRRKLREVEEDERVTKKAEERVADLTGGCCGKVASVCRPFTFLFGVIFFLLSIFLAVCLTMTSADKLIQITKNINDPDNNPKTGWNWKTGYSKITNSSVPNPIDAIFTSASHVFPLDYILVTLIVYYFVVASMAGVKQLGVRFCHLKMYKIRANRTVPQGLLFLAFILVFIILSLNIILLTLSPQYVSYGNQMYTPGVESDFVGKEQCVGFATYPVSPERCNSNAPQFQVLMEGPKGCNNEKGDLKCTGSYQIDLPVSSAFNLKSTDWDYTGNCTEWLADFQAEGVKACADPSGDNATAAYANIAKGDFESCSIIMPCIETRLSALLNAFFFNYWFLGMIYYWANWGFLAVFYLSLVYCTCKRRKSIYQSMVNDVQQDLIDSDDDMADFKPSWA